MLARAIFGSVLLIGIIGCKEDPEIARKQAASQMETMATDLLRGRMELEEFPYNLADTSSAVLYHHGKEGVPDGVVEYDLCGEEGQTKLDEEYPALSIYGKYYVATLKMRWVGTPYVLPYGETVIHVGEDRPSPKISKQMDAATVEIISARLAAERKEREVLCNNEE